MGTFGMYANVFFFAHIQEKNFKTMALPSLVLCGIFLFMYSASLFLENIFRHLLYSSDSGEFFS